jgi:PDZ domain-containing protein
MGRLPKALRARKSFVSLAVAVVVIGGGYIFADHGASSYYTIAPGTAPIVTASTDCQVKNSGNLALPDGKPCARLVLPPEQIHDVAGSIFMVDVLEGPTTPVQYVLSKLGLLKTFEDGTVLVHKSAVLGNTPSAQETCVNNEQMQGATTDAPVAALRRLGYTVEVDNLGAQIDLVQPGSPAADAGVHCGDLVTAIEGTPIHTDTDLVNRVRSFAPGDEIHITATRTGSDGKSQTVHLTAKLGPAPSDPHQAFLGVASETRTVYTFPFQVSVEVGNIGGPSAGLALTLGLLDALSNGHLTGGHHIAATGTIDVDGNVGPIGGAAQKAVSVRKAGATVFFVPPANLKDAQSEAGKMKVMAVTTLNQALNDLEAMGGTIPPPPGAKEASQVKQH